jgi:hypothetical protein
MSGFFIELIMTGCMSLFLEFWNTNSFKDVVCLIYFFLK